jgi:hypothetical protein
MPVKTRAEDGFTMIMTVIGITLVVLLAAVAVTAVNGDAQLSSRDFGRKQAYEAALAGINEYAYHLHANSAYWAQCTKAVPAGQPTALNQKGSTANRRPLPGTSSATYSIELIPNAGHSTCDPTSLTTATASMLEFTSGPSGAFRIRATGFSGDSKASVTATFKPASFLDYVYFTQRETSDPVTYGKQVLIQAANARCTLTIAEHRTEKPLANPAGEPLSKKGEALHLSRGEYVNAKGEHESPVYCDTISFVRGDNIKGPMRTNDVFVICQNPILGRGPEDPIIVSYPSSPGWLSTSNPMLNSGSSCNGEPKIEGLLHFAEGNLLPPETNSELKEIAEPAYRFEGEVNICLKGSTMIVGHGKQCEGTSKPLPPNGVIYVSSKSCTGEYTPFELAYEPEAKGECGNVNVQGTFSKPLTIAAANDVLITGNLTKTNEEGMLGLIANNFIRVYHPVTINHPIIKENCKTITEKHGRSHEECEEHPNLEVSECGGNLPGSEVPHTIEAALLALKHSFIVDNYDCGAQLGNLNVTGAIAQYYRGAVGTTNTSGYLKNYVYDQRLKLTEPPSFLEPIKSDWVIGRETTE